MISRIWRNIYVIYCSTTCLQQGEDENENQEVIKCLKQEIEEKNKYIAALKRRFSAFDDDVLEIEKNYNEEIDRYKRKINMFEQRINQLTSESAALRRESNITTHNQTSYLSNPVSDSIRLQLATSLKNTSEQNNIESSLYHELSGH
nr:unnamed protein product [Callosobruchus analis]